MEGASALSINDDFDNADDESTMEWAAWSGPDTFDELYEQYLARVYRYMRTRTRGEGEAADLTQQVFLQALTGFPKYRGDVPVAAWLFGIARNVATDFHRRSRTAVSWELLPESLHPVEPGPESAVLRSESLSRLQTLLMQLDADKRELLRLRFFAGLNAGEIAIVVGKSQAAVQKQITRTLRSLEEQYDEE